MDGLTVGILGEFMEANLLASVSGVVLSLAFSYIPGLKGWFDGIKPDYKRLVMLGALLLTAAGTYGLACIGRFSGISCDMDGIWQLIEAFVFAAVANQSAYALTPKGE